MQLEEARQLAASSEEPQPHKSTETPTKANSGQDKEPTKGKKRSTTQRKRREVHVKVCIDYTIVHNIIIVNIPFINRTNQPKGEKLNLLLPLKFGT